MTRDQALELIHDPAGRPADADTRQALELWLERDSELRAIDAQQQELFGALDDWATPQPSECFDEALYARIEAEPVNATGWLATLGRLLAPRPMAALAACAAAILLAVSIPTFEAPPEPVYVEKAAAGAEEVEYYEALDQALDDVEMLLEFEALAPGAEENRS